jgi:hypothetical protein
VTLTFDLWPWKSIGFQILLRTKYVPRLVKIHWRMLILECSQGCYAVKIWPGDLDLWPWKSIGFQILLRTKYVPSLVKIHWRMLILECSQGCYERTDGSITISLCNFVGEGIINAKNGIGSRSLELNVSFVNTFSFLCLNFYQLYQISRSHFFFTVFWQRCLTLPVTHKLNKVLQTLFSLWVK